MMLNHHLAVFIKTAEYKSATLAARELCISQPAVSNVLRRLEDELQVRLFYRDRKQGLILTDIGKQIYDMAKEMEDLDNRIYQAAFQERNLVSGKVRVAAVPFLTSAIIAPALQYFYAAYPGVTVELIEGLPTYISRAIETHCADFALSCTPYDAFDYETLISDRFVAMIPPEREALPAVYLQQTAEKLIINRPAYETLLEYSGYVSDRKQIVLVQQPESAIMMVASGVGIGIISEYTLDTLAPQLVKCPVVPEISMDIGIFAESLQHVTPAAAAFIRCIKEHVFMHSSRE